MALVQTSSHVDLGGVPLLFQLAAEHLVTHRTLHRRLPLAFVTSHMIFQRYQMFRHLAAYHADVRTVDVVLVLPQQVNRITQFALARHPMAGEYFRRIRMHPGQVQLKLGRECSFEGAVQIALLLFRWLFR